jgi:hypothetical protein
MFVVSMFYRMRSLVEGDHYFIKSLVDKARSQIFSDLIKYLIFYSILTAGVTTLEAIN